MKCSHFRYCPDLADKDVSVTGSTPMRLCMMVTRPSTADRTGAGGGSREVYFGSSCAAVVATVVPAQYTNLTHELKLDVDSVRMNWMARSLVMIQAFVLRSKFVLTWFLKFVSASCEASFRICSNIVKHVKNPTESVEQSTFQVLYC